MIKYNVVIKNLTGSSLELNIDAVSFSEALVIASEKAKDMPLPRLFDLIKQEKITGREILIRK